MQLSNEALKEFKEMLEQDHPGQEFTDDQVLRLATKMMRIVRMVYIPIPKKL